MRDNPTPPPIERVPIASVVVGDRRREDYGDIQSLARSVDRYGLIQPIVVDDGGRLVAGGRRLRACQLLGWDHIAAVRRADLSDAELRAIELEENTQRKPLSPYEEAKEMLARAADAVNIEPDSVQKSADEPRGRGRPRAVDSQRARAEAIGVSQSEIARADQHVTVAESHPLFQDPAWKEYQVLEADAQLKRLPEPEREAAVAVIDQPGVPPSEAVPILRNLAEMPAEQRGHVFALNASDDERDRQRALTTAAAKPPMPDPRLTILRDVLREVRRCASLFPDDPATPYIESVIEDIRAVVARIKECRHAA